MTELGPGLRREDKEGHLADFRSTLPGFQNVRYLAEEGFRAHP
jgi:hypothetical protein